MDIDDLKHEIHKNANTVDLAKDAVAKIKSLEATCARQTIDHNNQVAEHEAQYNDLVRAVNSNKGLLKAWQQSTYIKQLEAKVANHKKGGGQPIAQEKIDEILELKQLGKTNYRIAKMVGVSPATVAKYLN